MINKLAVKPSISSINQILLFSLLIFTPLSYGSVEIWSVTVMHTLSIAIIFLWIISMMLEGRITIYRSPVDLAAIIFISLACISALLSAYPYASRIQLYKLINYMALFYFVFYSIRDRGDLLKIVWVLIIFGSTFATAGLVMVGGELTGLKIFSPGHHMISLTFVNHNHFAGYLEIITWLCFGLALASSGAKRILLIFLGVYTATAVLFSLSRGGTIGLLAGMLFLLTVLTLSNSRRKTVWLLAGFSILVILVSAWLGIEPVLKRMWTLEDPILAGSGRLEIWKSTLNMISGNPWFGTGLGTFKDTFPRYQTENLMMSFVDHAHNDYLELTAEIGIIGVISAVFCAMALFFNVLKKSAVLPDKHLQAIGLGALTGCFSLLVHGMTDFNFQIPSNAILFSVCAAIALASADSIPSDKRSGICSFSLNKKWRIPAIISISLLSLIIFVIVISPLLGDIYLKQAKNYINNKDYESATSAIRKAIYLDPGNALHSITMGDVMAARSSDSQNMAEKKSFLIKSLKYYDDAINESPTRSYYYSKKGFILEKLEKFKEAEDSYENAIYFAPASAYAHYDLGTFYLKKGSLSSAFKEYREFLRLDSLYSNIFMVLDEIWEVTQDYDKIKDAMPEIADVRNRFATYLFNKGKKQAALTERSYAFSLQPTVMNAVIDLRGLYDAEEYSQALETGNNYLNKFGNDPSLLIQMANSYEKIGTHEKAISIYQRLIAENPEDISLYIKLSELYRRSRRMTEAVSTLQAGLQHKADSAELFFNIYICYHGMGISEKALEAIKKAVSLKPLDMSYRYQLGLSYKQIGLYQEAVDTWKKCLEIDSEYIGCSDAIHEMYEQLGI